ncbi:transglycosylase family protein [Streptomyces goshikiensis]|uniref:transglycosylase family protein n=1 Tax=Streptomyces goshikiensis TaxID=1942 RepID=UPI0036C150D6
MSATPRTTRRVNKKTTALATTALATTALGAALLATIPANAASVSTWDKVAHCESTDDWQINTGNGYYGGLQISPQTWNAFGGREYAAYPHQATKQQQILIGEKILAGQGQGAWPNCGPAAGLGSDHADPYPATSTPPAPVAMVHLTAADFTGDDIGSSCERGSEESRRTVVT